MNFKNFQIKSFIQVLIISLIYPVAKTMISISNKLLIFNDVLFIESLLLIIVGIIYHLYQKGDYTISFLILDRITKKNTNTSAFIKNENEKRENSFNNPLLIGIIELVISIYITWRFF